MSILPIAFDHITLIAVVSFFLGKFWSASAVVFASRQRAYVEFLRKCILVQELFDLNGEEEFKLLLPKLRDASAEFSLFASPKANQVASRYLGKLGFLLGANDLTDERNAQVVQEASVLYSELSEVMRRDTLGWTYYGMWDRLYRLREWKANPRKP